MHPQARGAAGLYQHIHRRAPGACRETPCLSVVKRTHTVCRCLAGHQAKEGAERAAEASEHADAVADLEPADDAPAAAAAQRRTSRRGAVSASVMDTDTVDLAVPEVPVPAGCASASYPAGAHPLSLICRLGGAPGRAQGRRDAGQAARDDQGQPSVPAPRGRRAADHLQRHAAARARGRGRHHPAGPGGRGAMAGGGGGQGGRAHAAAHGWGGTHGRATTATTSTASTRARWRCGSRRATSRPLSSPRFRVRGWVRERWPLPLPFCPAGRRRCHPVAHS